MPRDAPVTKAISPLKLLADKKLVGVITGISRIFPIGRTLFARQFARPHRDVLGEI